MLFRSQDLATVLNLVDRDPAYQTAYDRLVASGQPFTSSDLIRAVNQSVDAARLAENQATQSALSGPRTGPTLPAGYFDKISEANITKLLSKGGVYQQAYDQLMASGKPFTSKDLVSLTNNINIANSKADMAATQAGLQAKGSGLSFGEIGRAHV